MRSSTSTWKAQPPASARTRRCRSSTSNGSGTVPAAPAWRRGWRPGPAHEVVLVTALGTDEPAAMLTRLLEGRVRVVPLRLSGQTVTKTRIAAADVPLVRVDSGGGVPVDGPLPRSVVDTLARAGAVLVSDYGNGITALSELRDHLDGCRPAHPGRLGSASARGAACSGLPAGHAERGRGGHGQRHARTGSPGTPALLVVAGGGCRGHRRRPRSDPHRSRTGPYDHRARSAGG